MNQVEQFKLTYNLRFVLSRWFYICVGIIFIIGVDYLNLTKTDLHFWRGDDLLILFFSSAILNFIFLFLVQYVEFKTDVFFGRLLAWGQILADFLLVSIIISFVSSSVAVAPVLLLLPIIETAILLGVFETLFVSIFSSFALIFILTNFLTQMDLSILGQFSPFALVYLFFALVFNYHFESINNLNFFTKKQIKKDVSTTKTEQLEWVRKYGTKMEENNRRLYAKELELRIAKEELESLDKAKSKFISVTAHQMRTPLSGIKWTFNMMLSGQLGEINEEQAKFLKQGEVGVGQLITILNSLLEIDKIESKKLAEFKLDEVNIVNLIEDVIKEFDNQIESKKILLEFNKPTINLPTIQADPGKIRVVLENLIDNAIKYTPIGGRVEVVVNDDKLNSANQMIEVFVRDSGIGIPYIEQKKVFGKFFRASNAVGTEPDGSGVGLFITKDIIENHKGSLWFESKAGQGTTFHFTLPIRQA